MPPNSENKTEKPTPRRRRKAREEGQVAQSMEVNSVAVLLAAAGALALFGGFTARVVARQVTQHLGSLGAVRLDIGGVVALARRSGFTILSAVMPVTLAAAVVGLLVSLGQTGLAFAPNKVVPNLQAINPVRGLRELFSLQALHKVHVALAKFAVIGLVSFFLIRGRLDWLLALSGKSPWGIASVGRSLCFALLFRVLAAMVVVALLDYAYQRWRHEKQLMMTKQEVKEERKREEGDPEVRSQRMQKRRAMMQRMMSAVPEAQVVVTNPVHVAVALQWEEEDMEAPKVVAKGRGHMAERIKKVARENEIPVLERRPLARALYSAVEVGMEIPPKLYYAVAEVLAFVLGRQAA